MHTIIQITSTKINLKGKKDISIHFLMGVFALIVVLWMNYGLITYTLPFFKSYVRYGIYLIWQVLAIFINKRYFRILTIQIWPLIFFLTYTIIIRSLGAECSEAIIKSIIYLIMIYSIFIYYFNDKFITFQKILCTVLLIDTVVIGINTYMKLALNPYLARYLSTGTDTMEKLLGDTYLPGIGSYGYFYSLAAIILFLIFMLLSQNENKIIVLSLIMLATLLLIKAAFTIAVLLLMIFAILLVISKYANWYISIFVIILFSISLLIFQNAFSSIFLQLANIDIMPYEVSVRFEELSSLFSGKDLYGTDLNARVNLYVRSINAFTHNMLVGTSVNNVSIYEPGGHSSWLDLLATFGIFALLFYIFLYKAYRFSDKRMPNDLKSFHKIYWAYFISLGFINTLMFAQIYVMWFLFIPFLTRLYIKKKPIPVFDSERLKRRKFYEHPVVNQYSTSGSQHTIK